MLFAGGRPRPGLLLSACIRAAAQAHGCGEPAAPALQKSDRAEASGHSPWTRRAACLGKTPRVGIVVLLLLNCDGLFPDFEGLQGVLGSYSCVSFYYNTSASRGPYCMITELFP